MSMPPQGPYGACANCGTPFGATGQSFCATCGTAQQIAPPAPPVFAPPPPTYAPPPPANQFPQTAPYQQPDASQPPNPYQQPNPYYGQQPGWGGAPQGYAPSGPGVNKGVVAVIIGVVVVVAMVFGLLIIGISRNNSTAQSSPFTSASPSPSVTSSLPTQPPVATTGSITFAPSVLSCSSPVDMVMTTILPTSVQSGDSIAESFDGHSGGSTPVTEGGTTTHRADGTWVDVSTSSASSMQADCARGGQNSGGIEVLTPGVHVVTISDSTGNVLATGSYTVTGSAPTPTATAAGSIDFVPSTLSCSAPVDFVTVISLPFTVKSGDSVTETLDGAVYGTGTVSSATWTQLSDGSWTNTTTDSASAVGQACSGGQSVMAAGTHVVKVLDAQDKLLAQGQYTVTH
jgi:hypothetical protein